MTMFRVGQLVVAVPLPEEWKHLLKYTRIRTPLENGRVYTIREIDFRTVPLVGIGVIRVEEVVNKIEQNGAVGPWEPAWPICRFRPVATTDISWAHKLVADLPKSKTLIDS